MITLAPNRITLLALLLVGLRGQEARSQDYSPTTEAYSVRSLTGERAVFHVSFNGLKETLSIGYANDTVRVRHVLNLPTVQVLDDVFLRIVYPVHAGVGLHETRTLLLAARGPRICPSLSFTSGFTEAFLDFSQPRPSPKQVYVHTSYVVDWSLGKQPGPEEAAYYLTMRVRGKTRSPQKPALNAQYEHRVTLPFDPKHGIFYAAQEHVAQRVWVVDPYATRNTKHDLRGTFPVLTLGEYQYLYLYGVWYERNHDTDLTSYTY
jgi:hypothetical protein